MDVLKEEGMESEVSCTGASSVASTSSEEGAVAFINSLPDEILEYILSRLSPYEDYKNAMLVCRRWHRIVQGVALQESDMFHQSIRQASLTWRKLKTLQTPTVTDRYSHCACYHQKFMYVFGGCTSTCTTFNDLWRLDLSTGEWTRPIATGVYPSPTACATLVPYKDELILFGGWCHPTPYTFHQTSKLFNQLHSFNTKTHKWTQILCPVMPPGKAGHGATVVGDSMVVFGGYHGETSSSNQVWVYDILEQNWIKKEILGSKPLARYGHTQQLSDMWLLNMSAEPWTWQRIDVVNIQNAAPQLWCHPGCLVGDKIVVLSKNARLARAYQQAVTQAPPPSNSVWIPPKEDANAKDHRMCNCTFKRSHPETSESSSQESSSDTDEGSSRVTAPRSARLLALQKSMGRTLAQGKLSMDKDNENPGTSGIRPGLPSIRPNAMRNRQKQLETLKYYESKLKQMYNKPKEAADDDDCESCVQGKPRTNQNPMFVHVLDVSRVLTDGKATWLPTHESVDADTPEETIFHSLVPARGEVIMFGGVQMDLSSMQKGLQGSNQHASNAVLFLRPEKSLRS